jgi:hypothetical protein
MFYMLTILRYFHLDYCLIMTQTKIPFQKWIYGKNSGESTD